MKYALKNITIINLLLLAGIGYMFTQTLPPFLNVSVPYTLPSQKQREGIGGVEHYGFSPPSPAEYALIGEENLFHPERRIPPEKKVEPELPKPDFILYGTMIADDVAVAYLEDLKAPRTTPGRGKRQIAVKRGDSMSGFTLRELEADKIVMVRGEERIVVHMMNKQKPKQRDSSTTASQQAQAPAKQHQPPQQAPPTPPPPPKASPPKEVQPPKQDTVVRPPPPPRSSFEATVMEYFDELKR